MENENTGVEVQEVAEPANESVETQEVAEPVETPEVTTESGKNDADAAFAAQRRELQKARQKIAELEANAKAHDMAMQKLTGSNTGYIDAIADNLGADPDDVLATFTNEQEVAKKDLELEILRNQINEVKAESEMREALAEIQKIDPEVTKISDLGEAFINYTNAGLSTEEAYYAIKAKEINTRATPATPPGKANNEPPEKDFFTRDEVMAMSEDEQRANYEKILKSTSKWKG